MTPRRAMWLWAELSQDPNATWRSIAMAVVTIVAAVTFITHVYETLFLVREWENEFQGGEQLQRLNAEAELLALKSEVNPHTLFNNLNALTHLVEQGHPSAAAFVGALPLSAEDGFEAAGAARRRAGAARSVPVTGDDPLCRRFKVQVHANAHAAARWQIPPVVLPELLENAVKHNDFTTDNPLQIEIRLEGDRLTISHEKRPREATVSSTGVGLANLAQRFRFVVTLPLVATDGSNIAE